MRSLLPLVVAAVVLPIVALLARNTSAKARPVTEKDKLQPGSKQAALRRALVAGGPLADAWVRFFEAVAAHETAGKFHPNAHNKSKSEVEASRRAVYRTSGGRQPNVDKLEAAGQDPDAWVFGSKGLFQQLGPNPALEGSGTGYRFPKSVIHPDMAFDPGVAVAAAMDAAGGLMQWKNFTGDFADLLVGWGNPSNMGKASSRAAAVESFEKWGERVGWPRGWAYEKVPPLARRSPAENLSFAKAAKAAYYLQGKKNA